MKSLHFDFARFAMERNIELAAEGHKHKRPDWDQMACPFCTGEHDGYHLGFNRYEVYFNCWRCGYHSVYDVVMQVVSCGFGEAKQIVERYPSRPGGKEPTKNRKPMRGKLCHWPTDCHPLKKIHREYLKKRRYNPAYLEDVWGLRGTRGIGDYKYRVIAPVFYDRRMVSYQGRDVTDRSNLPYKACAQEDEARDHKHCLYGMDLVEGDDVVIIEGIFDTWRLGPGAVGTFGIDFTPVQANLLRRYRNKYIYYDSADRQAMEKAKKLANLLSAFRGDVEIIKTKWADPDMMPQREADKLMKELIGR